MWRVLSHKNKKKKHAAQRFPLGGVLFPNAKLVFLLESLLPQMASGDYLQRSEQKQCRNNTGKKGSL